MLFICLFICLCVLKMETVERSIQQSKRIKLDVVVESSLVQLPITSIANQLFLVDLRKLTIENTFHLHDTHSSEGELPPIFEKMNISLIETCIHRYPFWSWLCNVPLPLLVLVM